MSVHPFARSRTSKNGNKAQLAPGQSCEESMPRLAQSVNGRNLPILCHCNPPHDHDGIPTGRQVEVVPMRR